MHLKLICTHQAHQTPKKTYFTSTRLVLEGFDVPGGYKSILNVKMLHKSHIAELFGPRVFCFQVGQKSNLIADFVPTLKKILI